MHRLSLLVPFILFIAGCATVQESKPLTPADSVYYNGSILTMSQTNHQVEAIATRNGKIIDAGPYAKLKEHISGITKVIDLQGKTLIPGFIDAHSHFTIAMKMLAQANLSSPPVDSIRSIPDIILRLQEHKLKFGIEDGAMLMGWGYDPDQLAEHRHPTIEELSEAFPNNPVFILHASFHMGVVNQAALKLAGIHKSTPQPPGGMIVRDFDTDEATGLLQESAMYLVLNTLPVPTTQQLNQLFQLTQQTYARHGITTAQDGLTDFNSYSYLQQAAKNGDYIIDIEALASFRELEKYMDDPNRFGSINRLRLSGVKITTDGSPQGKTAFFKKPYLTKVPGCVDQCRGFPMVDQRQLEQVMTSCYANDIQLYVHCNGDASIDMLLDAHRKVTKSLQLEKDKQRTVVIHSQFVRHDQLEQYKTFKFVPSFFTNHAFFWGDVHTLNLGKERAEFLSPIQSALQLGITATNHTDYTVTPLDQLFLLWTSVNRTTRSGRILGAKERLTPYQGLQALTINSAYQHKQEHLKGSLEIGKLADFVILDKNPLEIPANTIKDINILETIKEGKTIFKQKI